MYEEQGQKLKEIRKNLKLSLSTVAQEVGITANYLSLIERGERKPSYKVMDGLSKYYNIPLDSIIVLYTPFKLDDASKGSLSKLNNLLIKLSLDDKISDDEKTDIIDAICEKLVTIVGNKK